MTGFAIGLYIDEQERGLSRMIPRFLTWAKQSIFLLDKTEG